MTTTVLPVDAAVAALVDRDGIHYFVTDVLVPLVRAGRFTPRAARVLIIGQARRTDANAIPPLALFSRLLAMGDPISPTQGPITKDEIRRHARVAIAAEVARVGRSAFDAANAEWRAQNGIVLAGEAEAAT